MNTINESVEWWWGEFTTQEGRSLGDHMTCSPGVTLQSVTVGFLLRVQHIFQIKELRERRKKILTRPINSNSPTPSKNYILVDDGTFGHKYTQAILHFNMNQISQTHEEQSTGSYRRESFLFIKRFHCMYVQTYIYTYLVLCLRELRCSWPVCLLSCHGNHPRNVSHA